MSKSYTMLEVAQHASRSSCWMVIDKHVYDVTSFLDSHPGGDDTLLGSAGRDATQEFEDVGHSSDARRQLKDLLIGTLREPTDDELRAAAADKAKAGTAAAVTQKKSAAIDFKTVMKFLLPVIIIGLAVIVKKFAT